MENVTLTVVEFTSEINEMECNIKIKLLNLNLI